MRESRRAATLPLLECACGFVSADLRTWKNPFDDKDYYNVSEMEIIDPPHPWVRHRVNRLRRRLASGVVADLGSGKGETVVALAADTNYAVIGVDDSKVAIDFLSSAFPSASWVHQDIIGYLRHAPPHDAVTMYHVLEHLPNPAEVCRLLSNAVRSGGVLAIEVPDVSSGQARQRDWGHYNRPHVNYFNLRTLRVLLGSSGFRLLECERKYNMTQPSGVRWKDAATAVLSRVGMHSVISTLWRRS